jgi:CRISPR/Cas system endoribonuclease Cas6 (RAMP superfamily)
MFLFHALVHNNCHSSLSCLLGGLMMDNAQLHPYDADPFIDGLVYDSWDPCGVEK